MSGFRHSLDPLAGGIAERTRVALSLERVTPGTGPVADLESATSTSRSTPVARSRSAEALMRSDNREAAVSIARQSRVRGRVGDRREGIAGVLASLLGGGQQVREASSFQHCLERELARVVPISGVNVRETEAHALPGPPSVRLGVFDAPSLRADRRVRLEVTLGATARLDAWDRQLLQTAAYLTALVVEIDRLRGGASRRAASRGQRDAAAPLIGASGVMQRMRERIERVARTDFSVLVEGESGP